VSEWWSYRLGSFLLFSQRTDGSLVVSYNAEVWPLQPVIAALGLAALLVSLWSHSPLHARWVPDPTVIVTIGLPLLAPSAPGSPMAEPLAVGALRLTMAWALRAGAA